MFCKLIQISQTTAFEMKKIGGTGLPDLCDQHNMTHTELLKI